MAGFLPSSESWTSRELQRASSSGTMASLVAALSVGQVQGKGTNTRRSTLSVLGGKESLIWHQQGQYRTVLVRSV